jgi:tight adherence protein B
VSSLALSILAVIVLLVIALLVLRSVRLSRNRAEDELHLGRLLAGRQAAEEPERTEETRPPGRLERALQAAGIGMPPMVAAVLIVLAGVAVTLLAMTISPVLVWAAPLAGLAAVWILFSLISEVARQRAWRFENRLVDAIDLMAGALSAGLSPVDALASAAEGALEPVKSELRFAAQQLQASVPVERALRRMSIRYPCEGVRIFTQLLIAKWEIGGPFAPVLQSVNRTMRHGLRLRSQLHTQVAGAQMSAIIVALIPYLLIAFFAWKRPEAIERVWSLPWGPQLFVAAILLQIAGFIWLRRILRTEL